MPKPWTPKIVASQRIAGRLVRAHRGNAIQLTMMERQACIDVITTRFLSQALRRKMGSLWFAHGPQILEIGWQDANPNPEVDPHLDALVTPLK